MLQKPDLEKLDLGDEVAKSRLIELWGIIDELKWVEKKKPIVVDLETALPHNRGDISAFLGGKRVMSEPFYSKFIKKYGSKQTKSMDDDKRDISDLNSVNKNALDEILSINKIYASAHKELTQAHLKAIDTNADILSILKNGNIIVGEAKHTHEDLNSILAVYERMIYDLQMKAGIIKTLAEGQENMDKALDVALKKGKAKRILDGAGK